MGILVASYTEDNEGLLKQTVASGIGIFCFMDKFYRTKCKIVQYFDNFTFNCEITISMGSCDGNTKTTFFQTNVRQNISYEFILDSDPC